MSDVYVDMENGLSSLDEMIYFLGYPSAKHETILFEVLRQFGNYFYDKSCCKVYGPTTGLNLGYRFSQIEHLQSVQVVYSRQIEEGRQNIISLAPDIQVICKENWNDWSDFDSLGYKGVPKLIVEVYSPSTGYNDYSFKKDIYEVLGVSEYWIIQNIRTVDVFRLCKGVYVLQSYKLEQNEEVLEIPVQIFEGLVIKLNRGYI